MKTRLMHLATLLGLVLLMPALLQAQMAIKQPLMRVNIPFAFVAGGVHLPAGQYDVYHPGDPYFVIIQKDDRRARATVYVQPSATGFSKTGTKLVFNRYGDLYFLSQVWSERNQEMAQCIKCRTEKSLMAKGLNQQVVIVASIR